MQTVSAQTPADPARALRMARRATEPQPGLSLQLTELVPRPDRGDLAASEAKMPAALGGLAVALKSTFDRLVASLTRGAAGNARANCRRVEEALGFDVGHLPQQLRNRLGELGELRMAAKERQDAAILSCDPLAFGEAHHESVEISKQVIELLQSFDMAEPDPGRS